MKDCGVSLFVHAKCASDIRTSFGIGSQTWLSDIFDTVITEPHILTFRHVLDVGRISTAALGSARVSEIVVVDARKQPVRLHPADPDMIMMLQAHTRLPSSDLAEPWNAPAVVYPSGSSLPKPKQVTIPKQKAKATPSPANMPMTISSDPKGPDKPRSKPLVTKDDLASSTARLRKALAKRTADSPQIQNRTI